MHDDIFPAAEKILTDIENIFKRDKLLKDFEIVPVTVGENKSPVLHAEHTLGLQEWCVRHLYVHVYHKVMNLKRQQRLRREDPSVLSRLLLGGVLLNPDCTTLWNIRREFVVLGRFDPLTELHINAITLSRRPKSAESFVYRRWILKRMTAEPLESATLSSIIEEELQVSLMAADRYANNYHAWNHRMWVMSHIPQAQDKFYDEWTTSEIWVSKHVSEHSGLQYREFLLNQVDQHLEHTDYCLKFQSSLESFLSPLKHSIFNSDFSKHSTVSQRLYQSFVDLLDKKESCSQCPMNCKENNFMLQIGFLAYELLLVTDLIHLYPGHEALWCHRRFVLFCFFSLSKKISCNSTKESDIMDGIPLPKTQKLCVLEIDSDKCFLWWLVMQHEDALIKDCVIKTTEESYQTKLALRHEKWIKSVLICKENLSCRTQSVS
ncbi:Protein prenyltransferase alpha subunit repeat-containing protein 1 [Frankliniella fusca]|uniref:Protein prenyltransferase alpha subunit repeat-containing protein 1 n=1 Tax=Frankliniella fusca TaxID=407009 RepID=A0AAE1I010_9NEOP|nr:Protein prenyltransferase alpha subunit repeat-containing protein 1 [Frankliniella fusca]